MSYVKVFKYFVFLMALDLGLFGLCWSYLDLEWVLTSSLAGITITAISFALHLVFLYFVFKKENIRCFFNPLRSLEKKGLVLSFALSVFVFLGTNVIGSMLGMEFYRGLKGFSDNIVLGYMITGGFSILNVSFEELLFRGFFLSFLLVRHLPLKAILFTSVLFLFFHYDSFFFPHIGNLVTLVLSGVIYGYIYFISRSLLQVVLIHFCGNMFFDVGAILNLRLDFGLAGGSFLLLSLSVIIVFFLLLRVYSQIYKDKTLEDTGVIVLKKI